MSWLCLKQNHAYNFKCTIMWEYYAHAIWFYANSVVRPCILIGVTVEEFESVFENGTATPNLLLDTINGEASGGVSVSPVASVALIPPIDLGHQKRSCGVTDPLFKDSRFQWLPPPLLNPRYAITLLHGDLCCCRRQSMKNYFAMWCVILTMCYEMCNSYNNVMKCVILTTCYEMCNSYNMLWEVELLQYAMRCVIHTILIMVSNSYKMLCSVSIGRRLNQTTRHFRVRLCA